MKKFNIVLVLIAILLLVSSCKKEEVVVQTTKEYPIKLWSNNDSKATIVPNGTQAGIKFEVGDHIYLAYQGYCRNSNVQVKKIDGEKIDFSGHIKITTGENDNIDKSPLFFYFLGGVHSDSNKDYDFFTEVGLNGTPDYTTVCISLQNRKNQDLPYHSPVLCFGKSSQAFSIENKVYNTTFENKCSLVKYSIVPNDNGEKIPNDARVYIQGLNNVVEVDFKVAHKYYNNGDATSERYPGCDRDGFRYVKREGIIQSQCSPTKKEMRITNIIIPDRDGENKCYSILLPQKNVGKGKGNELFGYYFKKSANGEYITDANGKCVPTYLKVHFPYDNVVTNKYYECTIEVDEDQEAAHHPDIIDYPYDAKPLTKLL
ncbi:MAG: hypothetical protein ACI35Y_07555 [Candidatus Limimorpha sp.]